MNHDDTTAQHDAEARCHVQPYRSLLIVDDDKDSCEMLLLVIRKRFPALVVHCASNGRIGWEMFQRHTPQVVISDLNMPEMDGLQMADLIRRHTPATRLIALSAHTERAVSPGLGSEPLIFDAYVVKPYKFSTLLAEIGGNDPQQS